MRRTALILGVHRTTVARKLILLGARYRDQLHEEWKGTEELSELEFDELETMEHAKGKPLSVLVVVTPKTRKIVGIEVARMPCKGRLAPSSRRKYGVRADERPKAFRKLFTRLTPLVSERAVWVSDSNPRYPFYLKKYFPRCQHVMVEGQRGCIRGQGELKKVKFDPLFSLNHTMAMLRANVSRLIRQTWCTTKKAERLSDHLALYAYFHNTVLT
jgi:hypothetical protein